MESALKDLIFTERTSEPDRFFEILPEDWLEGIVPFWNEYQDSSQIFTLEIEYLVIGGGITFSKPAPDTLAYENVAQEFFNENRLYFGFLWLNPSYRGNDLGSVWIKNLRLRFPNRKFWLAIEDLGLSNFYQKNGFNILKKVEASDTIEWIMID